MNSKHITLVIALLSTSGIANAEFVKLTAPVAVMFSAPSEDLPVFAELEPAATAQELDTLMPVSADALATPVGLATVDISTANDGQNYVFLPGEDRSLQQVEVHYITSHFVPRVF